MCSMDQQEDKSQINPICNIGTRTIIYSGKTPTQFEVVSWMLIWQKTYGAILLVLFSHASLIVGQKFVYPISYERRFLPISSTKRSLNGLVVQRLRGFGTSYGRLIVHIPLFRWWNGQAVTLCLRYSFFKTFRRRMDPICYLWTSQWGQPRSSSQSYSARLHWLLSATGMRRLLVSTSSSLAGLWI